MFNVAAGVANAAIRYAGKGHDPLQVGPLFCQYGSDSIREIDERLQGVRGDMAKAVATEIGRHLEELTTFSNPDKAVTIDPLFARLLAHEGVDPLVVCLLALQCGRLEVDDTVSGYRRALVFGSTPPADPANGTEILLGLNTVWTQKGTMYLPPNLPDTVAVLLEGRPLRDVVSHPVLDTVPLTITSTDHRGSVIHIHTDFAPVCATVEELYRAMPRD